MRYVLRNMDVIKIPGGELEPAYNHYSLHSTDVTKSKSKIRPLYRKFDSIEGRRKVLEEKLVMHGDNIANAACARVF